jgi:23S rRNA pseudouridine1911/1915/1917 synthase
MLVEARPHTGRKHQVRAHLSGCGMPIAGDRRYGGPMRLGRHLVGRPLLHASRLALTHPLNGRRLEITCDYPDDFRAMLDRLRFDRRGLDRLDRRRLLLTSELSGSV